MSRRFVVTLAMMAAAACVAQKTRPVTVQVLAINDLHGNLEPPTGSSGKVNATPAGGTEYLATHLKQAEKRNPNSILVGAGDMMGASPLLSALFKDEPTVEALNAMHLSVTSIGNHELDHGPDELKRRLKDAKYQYLAANVVRKDTGATLFPSTAVRIVGGVKIGLIGEILEDSPSVIAGQSIRNLRFLEESHVANEAAARLERQGVHAIVLLIHQGGMQYVEKSIDTDPNGCVGFKGEIADIAEKLSPAIKVVLSAHTHQFYNCEIAGHTVTSAGSYGRLFTRINLTINRRTDRIIALTAKNEIVTRDVPKDPTQTAILAKYEPREKAMADKVEGSITATITHRGDETGSRESALGDVVADAQLAATQAPDQGGAVIAFMNSGGLRADLVQPEGAQGPSPVSFGDLYAVQPFGNHLTVATMTGKTIRLLLEQQFHVDGSANVLQVSDGFSYKYRLHAEQSQHVLPGSIMLRGRPIADGDVLRIEASDFLMGGGDGLTAFRDAKDKLLGPADIDALVEYFHKHSPVAPGAQNRIVRMD
ncbi:bifunctional metallophosphatase/5'-nucleotidase [Granulicella paludicola]|uniref:bifunctional metallophosphatase/5'-nucleotidase n=1 Tax=Granulicella paludicola TaxID=474951 RepID=UPI0021DFE22A|nr:bifunctional metallophosphatase/5'-nucleotidase [Granulicella paludicola]